MSNGQLGAVLSHVHRLVGVPSVEELGDGQLLERFLQTHEEGAFAALVRRHGPMVLGVCRRLLQDPHAAEDAFQATFIVLLRRARSLDRHPSLGGWLHTVAFHVARKARADAFRRQRRQRPLVDQPCLEAPAVEFWSELQTILDEELNRLPENYRAAVVLCYLEGKTNAEAARLLRWPVGTVKGRLARARVLLRHRLGRRGLTVPVGLLATLLAEKATAALPGALIHTTIRIATIAVTSTAPGASAAVLALAQGALKTMFLSKLKIAAALVLAVAFIVFGVGVGSHQAQAQRQTQTGTDEGAQPRLPNERAAPSAPLLQPGRFQGEQKKLTFAGEVLGPDKQGLAGATVAVVAGSQALLPRGVQALGQARTDQGGKFRLTVTCPAAVQPSEIVIFASAKGHGLGWGMGANAESVVVQLEPEQMVRGRLIDLQGQPAAGVKLIVSRLGNRDALQRGPRSYRNLDLSNSHLMALGLETRLGGEVRAGQRLGGLRLSRRVWEDEPHALLRAAVLMFLDPPVALPLWPAPVTTDAQGRFMLRGLGPGLGIGLQLQDERFALQVLDIPPRGKEEEESRYVLAPPRILEGTLTDSETGKPLPRARLRLDSRCATCHEDVGFVAAAGLLPRCGGGGADWKGRRGAGDAWNALHFVGAWINERSDVLHATEIEADAQGRFRLPLHEAPGYTLHVVAGRDEPYLSKTQTVSWPGRAVVRQQLKVELLRGLPVRGKIVEEPGGKPVADARVDFWAKDVKLPTGTHWPRALKTRPDGTFEALLPPGSWYLLVNAANGDYVPQKIAVSKLGDAPDGPILRSPPEKGAKGEPYFWPDAHTVVEAKAGAKVPPVTVSLRRAPLLRGRLVTGDGKPITTARMFAHQATAFEQAVYLDEEARGQIDQTQLQLWHRRVSLDLAGVLPPPDAARGTIVVQEIRDGTFAFPVSNPGAVFHLAFLDEKGKLGAVARVEGKQAGGDPVTVRLAGTGAARARFVDAAGKPLANYRPLMWLLLPPGPHPLPQNLKTMLGSGVRAEGALWLGHADPARHGDGPRTDTQGRLTLPALIGGAIYRVQQSGRQAHDFTVQAGQTVVLPDLVVEQSDQTAKLPTAPAGK
ncbi:MAG TPA: RNA polymerase sigma factor [Gemmataceae bacterium]|nr:RNA polymerase sigma factor [Gemmataceae bacterium]